MNALKRAWSTWVGLWDLREPGTVLALIRVLLGLVICWDFATVLWLDLAVPLFGREAAGGWSTTAGVWVYHVLPETAGGALAYTWAMVGLSLLFAAGLGTPVVTVLLLLLYAQSEALSPLTDRAIDRLLRNVLMILVFAQCARAWSVDAWLRTRRWAGDGALVPAWPRHLIVLQLVVVYTATGFAKLGAAWGPAGEFSALYRVLSDPGTVAFQIPALDAWYPLTQVATGGTVLWECSAPLVLLAYWYRHTASRPGRLRAAFNRWRPERWWLAAGVLMHLGIAVFLSLGIFSWGILALYPAFAAPARISRAS